MTTSKDSGQKRWGIAPLFTVADVAATANYYRDTLGFGYDRLWGNPPRFCMVSRGGVVIMLSEQCTANAIHPNRLVDPEGEQWDAYIWVDDADALFAEFKAKGVRTPREICDQEYGCRDFDVEDCNGYRLCFGHPLT